MKRHVTFNTQPQYQVNNISKKSNTRANNKKNLHVKMTGKKEKPFGKFGWDSLGLIPLAETMTRRCGVDYVYLLIHLIYFIVLTCLISFLYKFSLSQLQNNLDKIRQDENLYFQSVNHTIRRHKTLYEYKCKYGINTKSKNNNFNSHS